MVEEVVLPAVAGKYTFKGVVVGFKTVESQYGITEKMIVKHSTDNWKVYVTVPSSIYDVNKGDTIEFTATFEVAENDNTFAFAKRPTKASIISRA